MAKFTVRELLAIVTIAAMGLGWWVHARQLQHEMVQRQSDLVHQADLVRLLAGALTQPGCEIPADSGPYTRVVVPHDLLHKGLVSTMTTVPREQLQRALDGEFGKYRHSTP